jgi:hypothetical protein
MPGEFPGIPGTRQSSIIHAALKKKPKTHNSADRFISRKSRHNGADRYFDCRHNDRHQSQNISVLSAC